MLMKNWHKPVNQAGDTIVEVLIATAVVSSVLAGAFLVSQKSSLAVRDSQEHSEMSQVLQGQVEMVRSMALDAPDAVSGVFGAPPGGTKYFCIDGSIPATPARIDFPSGFNLPATDVDNYGSYPPKCANIQNRYNIAVTYDPSSQIFTFTGRWDRLSGGKNQEQLSYRIYPGSVVSAPPSVMMAVVPVIPAVPTGETCADMQAKSLIDPTIKYFNVRDYAVQDWHVKNIGANHPISTVHFTLSIPMSAGNYRFWSISKDDSYASTGSNKRLHYVGFANSGARIFQTSDTPEMPKVKPSGGPSSPESASLESSVSVTQAVHYLLVEHSPIDPTSVDDSVDSACLAYQEI
jgi:type II secretory pathway pseudopilin PulG